MQCALIEKAPMNCNHSSGYTLIQVAIALAVIGVLMAPMLSAYNLYKKNQKIAASFEVTQTISAALQNFRDNNGFYPCPSPLKTPRGLIGYGTATACSGAAALPAITALSPGDCDTTLGICVEESIRTTLANRRVIVGAVPFRTLQLDEKQALDPYGARLVYAITESMTQLATIDDSNGGIAVRKADGTPLLTPDGSATFFLFSPGPSGTGGYSLQGSLMLPCAGVSADLENCTDGFEDGAGPVSSLYVADVTSDAPGPNFFDDFTSFFSDQNNPMWLRIPANPETVTDLSPDGVGVGGLSSVTGDLDIVPRTSPVVEPMSLYVRNLGTGSPPSPAEYAGVHVQTICDLTGANCFAPSVLAGDPTATPTPTGGMLCTTGAMLGIENGAPICGNLSFRCPAGQILTSINGAGQPVCGNVPQPNCPPATRSVCSPNDVSLPLGANNATSLWSGNLNAATGGCRRVKYKCTNGAWSATPSTDQNAAYCSFTSTTETTATGLSCASINPGYTGTYSKLKTTLCGGSSSNNTTIGTDCICTGTTQTTSFACSDPIVGLNANYTGTAIRTRTYSPPACGYSDSWDKSGCTCPPQADTTQPGPSCPSPFTGGSTQTLTFNTTTCSWSVASTTPLVCTCPNTFTPDYNTVPVCADPVCESPNVMNVVKKAIDPTSCLPTGPEILVSAGSCASNVFSWQVTGTVPPTSTPNVDEGSPCDCDQKNSNEICSTLNGVARCTCL